MKILSRFLMLIAVIVALIVIFFWLMKQQAKDSSQEIKLPTSGTMLQSTESYSGLLVYDQGVFYLETADKTRLPVASKQLDLFSFKDKQVSISAKMFNGVLEIGKIEQR